MEECTGEVRERHGNINRSFHLKAEATRISPTDLVASAFRRKSDDQRNAQRRVVSKHPVCQLAVIAEAFTVIAGDGDERAPGLPGGAQPVEDPRDLRVGNATSPS